MIELTQKIVFKQTARLLIAASALCVFFGNGVHVHAIFDHLFEHGHVHAFVHSHSEDHEQNYSHAEEFGDEDAHQHPTATVDLTGTITQKSPNKASANSDLFSSSGILSSYSISQSPIPIYFRYETKFTFQ